MNIEEFQSLVEKNGVDNIMVISPLSQYHKFGPIAFTSSNDTPVAVPCKINEDRHKVSRGYKVEIKPLKDYRTVFCGEDFYIEDFISLIDEGIIKIYLQVK